MCSLVFGLEQMDRRWDVKKSRVGEKKGEIERQEYI